MFSEHFLYYQCFTKNVKQLNQINNERIYMAEDKNKASGNGSNNTDDSEAGTGIDTVDYLLGN